MNILFILGNGFDINLGLKTRYQDFYDVYSKNHSNYDSVMKLKDHIGKNTDGYWSDLELALGDYTNAFKCTEDFDEVTDDIKLSLSSYLDKVQAEFDSLSINEVKFLYDLMYPEVYLTPAQKDEITKFKNVFQNTHWRFSIVTFNYTHTVERIIEKNDSSEIGSHDNTNRNGKLKHILDENVNHIHGYVNDRMILGVNDLSQVANTDLHNNIDIEESLIKSKCNEASGQKSNIFFDEKIENADLICAFGLSFGDSDKIWWEKIGQKLESGTSRMLIFDRSTNENTTLSYKDNRTRRKVKHHFLSQTGLTEDMQNSISSRVYVGINTSMFQKVAFKPEKTEVADKFGNAKIDLLL
ncbi:bacteriophage abortive infection AbiH family protein [Psychrobacter sp. TB55-MNA-CIBAN-0194]|uniref:bacteriophage abortive infection AbiH family protein n=1 Tax=Psychrobacter sp. TB55-MNA-CIBAN-0194 TaxID=3140445 RepID=UPI00332D8DC5